MSGDDWDIENVGTEDEPILKFSWKDKKSRDDMLHFIGSVGGLSEEEVKGDFIEMNDTKIEPCPVCGSKDLWRHGQYDNMEEECNTCGAKRSGTVVWEPWEEDMTLRKVWVILKQIQRGVTPKELPLDDAIKLMEMYGR